MAVLKRAKVARIIMPEDDSGITMKKSAMMKVMMKLTMNTCLILMTMWMASSFEDC